MKVKVYGAPSECATNVALVVESQQKKYVSVGFDPAIVFFLLSFLALTDSVWKWTGSSEKKQNTFLHHSHTCLVWTVHKSGLIAE